jgi:hypothetical protein
MTATRRELRYAKYDGEFIQEVEISAEKMSEILPSNFPVMASQSRKQMKDLELVGSLLLLVEEGARSYSQAQIDVAYANRDEDWVDRGRVGKEFTGTLIKIADILRADPEGGLAKSRLKNQADFYSLFGAVHDLQMTGTLPPDDVAVSRLKVFLQMVDDPEKRSGFDPADAYYAASRSASNDQGPRQTRINMLKGMLSGELLNLLTAQ